MFSTQINALNDNLFFCAKCTKHDFRFLFVDFFYFVVANTFVMSKTSFLRHVKGKHHHNSVVTIYRCAAHRFNATRLKQKISSINKTKYIAPMKCEFRHVKRSTAFIIMYNKKRFREESVVKLIQRLRAYSSCWILILSSRLMVLFVEYTLILYIIIIYIFVYIFLAPSQSYEWASRTVGRNICLIHSRFFIYLLVVVVSFCFVILMFIYFSYVCKNSFRFVIYYNLR